MEHRSQTTCLHPALSYAAASIFLQLYLYPAVCSHFFLQISFSNYSLVIHFLCGLVPCGVHCSACLVMLSSFLLNACPSQFHFLLRIWSCVNCRLYIIPDVLWCCIERIRAASEQKAAEVHAMAVEVGRHICAKACRLWPLSARCPVGKLIIVSTLPILDLPYWWNFLSVSVSVSFNI